MKQFVKIIQDHNEIQIKGEFQESKFAMEPGAPYGDPDSYSVESRLPGNIPAGVMIFGSLDQLEEFSRFLSEYVERRKAGAK